MGLRLRSRFGRLRRRDKVLGVVGGSVAVVAVSLAVLSNSFFCYLYAPFMGTSLVRGGVHVSSGARPEKKWQAGFGRPEWPEWPDPWVWMPYHIDAVPWHAYVVPLWIPLLFGHALATPAGLGMRRLRFDHLCPACGYDKTGLAAGAVCPECGEGR